jgi:hypothetical protein
MLDIPKSYISACSNSCQLVPLHPIIISVLFHHYKELLERIERLSRQRLKVKKIIVLSREKKDEKPQQRHHWL